MMRRALIGLAATLACVLGPTAVAQAAIAEPNDDPFYRGPVKLKGVENGAVLRSREVTVTTYGLPVANVKATQILYRSTSAKGRAIAAVTTLLVPTTPYGGRGTRPLVAYQPAIDSLGDQCNPSYTLRTGTEKEAGQIQQLLGMGYAVVATDFEGLDSAFAAGPLAGRTVLDALKAAEALPGSGLAGPGTPVGMFGYSGGSQATMWASELQPAYAPGLNLKGTAGGGTPADIEISVRQILGGPFAGLGFLGVFGVEREYPELALDQLLNDKGRQLKRDLADACLTDAAASYPFAKIEDYTVAPDPFSLPVVQAVVAELHLGKTKPSAPVYLYHSVADELIPVEVEDAFATRYCQMGVPLQYTREATGDHNSEAVAGAPAAFAWLADRFNGLPPPTDCGTFPPGRFSPGYAAFDCAQAAPTTIRVKKIGGRRVRRVAVFSDAERVAIRKGRSIRRVRLKNLKPGYVELALRLRSAGHRKTRHVKRIVKCA